MPTDIEQRETNKYAEKGEDLLMLSAICGRHIEFTYRPRCDSGLGAAFGKVNYGMDQTFGDTNSTNPPMQKPIVAQAEVKHFVDEYIGPTAEVQKDTVHEEELGATPSDAGPIGHVKTAGKEICREIGHQYQKLDQSDAGAAV